MKDEIITVIIFILLVTLFVYNSVTIERRTSRLISYIEEANENIDTEDAKMLFYKVRDKWAKEKKALFYISSHNFISQIDENIIMGCDYIKDGNTEKALFNFKKAKFLLEELYKKEKIRLDNIF